MLGRNDNNESIKWPPILPYATRIEIFLRISGLKKFMLIENVIQECNTDTDQQ